MSLFSTNSSSFKIFALLSSQIWTALVGLIFTPIYIRIIGVESFGLVAFYTSLTTSLAILDLGLSTAISRQLSIMQADGSSRQDQRILLFSIERVYWVVAVLLGLAIVLMSYPIAAYWVNSKELPVSVIRSAVILMGIAFTFQWPNSIYTGSLVGLQQQQKSAIVSFTYATLRAFGIIAALKFISPTIECFFIAQIVVTAIQVLLYRIITWKQLSLPDHKPHFSRIHLQKIKRFAAGITGISLVSFALTQIDKLVVSKMVLLEFVGYYNLAFVLANFIVTIVNPMQTVFFPKFSALFAAAEEEKVVALFYKTARLIAVIAIPMAVGMVFFAEEILWLWTHNVSIAENTAPILRFAAIGTACNVLNWVPYFYLLAKGITRFTIYQNIIASIVLTPLLFWLTGRYGAVGASFVWLIVNTGYLFISLPLFHHLYFRGHLRNWYINNLIRPLLVAVPLIGMCKYILKELDFHYNIIGFGAIIFLLIITYILLTRETREYLLAFYHKRINHLIK